MSFEQRAQILREAPPNSWIALSEDETQVVGRGSTYADALEAAKLHGEEDPLLIKTPEDWKSLVLCA